MPKKKIRPTKNTILSRMAEMQFNMFLKQYGHDIVNEIVKGMRWTVAHDPFSLAEPVVEKPNRWVVATYTVTIPAYELVYVFLEGDDQRKIIKFNITPAESSGDCP